MGLDVIDSSPFGDPVLSVADQLHDLVDVVDIFPSLVAIVAEDDPLPHGSLDELVHEQ